MYVFGDTAHEKQRVKMHYAYIQPHHNMMCARDWHRCTVIISHAKCLTKKVIII